VEAPDPRPALVLNDVREATVRSLAATAPSEAGPVVWLHATRECLLDGIRSPAAETLARLSGPETAGVRIAAGSRDPAPQVVLLDPEVSVMALRAREGVITRRRRDASHGHASATW
jgi:hypothetical protein